MGKLWVNGTDANLEQVNCGMTWLYDKYATVQVYFLAGHAARNTRSEIWNHPNPTPPWVLRQPVRAATAKPAKPPALACKSAGRCGEKRFCKEMTDCPEARYFLNVCGAQQLDGDGDGRPCEGLCQH